MIAGRKGGLWERHRVWPDADKVYAHILINGISTHWFTGVRPMAIHFDFEVAYESGRIAGLTCTCPSGYGWLWAGISIAPINML